MASLQEAIDGALALLPADNKDVKYDDWKNQVLAKGDINAAAALEAIVRGRTAKLHNVRDEKTQKLVLYVRRGA